MPPSPLIDLTRFSSEQTLWGPDVIRDLIPHRHEMSLIDGVVFHDPDDGSIAGFKDVRDSEFWVRGHIPGRPLFPGVLIIEAAAQLCSIHYQLLSRGDDAKAREKSFIGLGGLDRIRYRGTVVPGDRLLLLARSLGLRSRMAFFETQALVNDCVVFEGRITGVRV